MNSVILGDNYPNPFNPSGAGRSPTTTITFNLTAEDAENAEIIIYNIKGQKVKELLIVTPSPSHSLSVTWYGTDENNQPVGSGVYLYKLKIDDQTVATKKMMLLK